MSEAIFLHFKFFVNSNDKKDVNKIFGKYQHHLIPDLLIFKQINEMPCTYMSGSYLTFYIPFALAKGRWEIQKIHLKTLKHKNCCLIIS